MWENADYYLIYPLLGVIANQYNTDHLRANVVKLWYWWPRAYWSAIIPITGKFPMVPIQHSPDIVYF